MQKSVRVIGALALIALGFWVWRTFNASPEKIIRSRLLDLAATASFKPSDGIYPKASKAAKIPEFFTVDAEVNLELRGFPPRSFSGRDELSEAAKMGIGAFRGLKVEFLDINVKLGDDKQTALADLTAKGTVAGESDFYVAELNVTMKKVKNDWLISKVETVKP